jgi:hypothetical protein
MRTENLTKPLLYIKPIAPHGTKKGEITSATNAPYTRKNFECPMKSGPSAAQSTIKNLRHRLKNPTSMVGGVVIDTG